MGGRGGERKRARVRRNYYVLMRHHFVPKYGIEFCFYFFLANSSICTWDTQAEMATLKKSHQSELESCRKDRSTWQAQASDLQQQLETALASATSAETSHQQALASCEFKHSAAIAALEAEHANKLAEAARAAKASSGGDNHKGGSNGNDGDAEVASSSGTAMQQLQQQLDNALRDLASANARCAAAEVSAAEAVTSRQSSQASLEAQIADLNRKLVNTDAKAKQAMADAEEEWTRRVEDLESDLAAAQAAQDAERLKVGQQQQRAYL